PRRTRGLRSSEFPAKRSAAPMSAPRSAPGAGPVGAAPVAAGPDDGEPWNPPEVSWDPGASRGPAAPWGPAALWGAAPGPAGEGAPAPYRSWPYGSWAEGPEDGGGKVIVGTLCVGPGGA